MKLLERLVSVVAIVAICSCRNSAPIESFERPVKVYEVESIGAVDKSFAATVESAQKSILAFQSSGELIDLLVEAGDKVKKGVKIAAIDPIDFQLQVDAAKARYLTSSAEEERYKRLLSKNVVSQQQYESSYANYISLKSAYENSQERLKQTILYAPFSGIIEKVYLDNYQRVQPTEPVVKLINPDTLEVMFTIAPSDAKLLYAPQIEYFVSFDNVPSQLFAAKLRRFVDISIGGEGLPMVVTLDNSRQIASKYGIRAGYACNVIIRVSDGADTKYCAVPLTSIYQPKADGNEKYVWLYNGDTQRVSMAKIEVGELFGDDMIAVKSGIKAGDMVVVAGVSRITEGERVKLLKK